MLLSESSREIYIMPMRIANNTTNAMNSRNVNTNKLYLSKLNSQMATEKKIQGPSEDPTIAMNALRYRDDLYRITQYYEKNSEDAGAWLQATSSAVESTVELLSTAKELVTTGAPGTNTIQSRKAVLEQLSGVVSQIYENGNSDYAGRFLFSGWRTSTGLTFTEDDNLAKKYTDITEKLGAKAVDQVTYISNRVTVSGTGSDEAVNSDSENDVKNFDFYRLRLAYDELDDTNISLTYKQNGAVQTVSPTIMSLDDFNTKLNAANTESDVVGDNDAIFIAETGELILGSKLADELRYTSDETDFITVKYDKSDWETGDIRPELYYECKIDGVEYNNPEGAINYDISNDQQTQVNIYASQVFDHGIGRDLKELNDALSDAEKAEEKIKALEAMLEEPELSDTEKTQIQKSLDAAKKEQTLVNDKLQAMFEHAETTFGKYLDNTVYAGTEVGARGQRLELIQNRLLVLETTTQQLASDNENVQLTEVAVKINEAEVSYTAALQALGKVSNLSLLNYV